MSFWDRWRRFLGLAEQFPAQDVAIVWIARRVWDIPRVFAAYNHYQNTLQENQFKNIYRTLLKTQRADCCISCGTCKSRCPQAIDIPAQMKRVAELAAGIM